MRNSMSDSIARVAEELNLSKTVVEGVIRAYVEDMRDKVLKGETVVCPRLFTIKSEETEAGVLALRGQVSQQLRQFVKMRNSSIEVQERLNGGADVI